MRFSSIYPGTVRGCRERRETERTRPCSMSCTPFGPKKETRTCEICIVLRTFKRADPDYHIVLRRFMTPNRTRLAISCTKQGQETHHKITKSRQFTGKLTRCNALLPYSKQTTPSSSSSRCDSTRLPPQTTLSHSKRGRRTRATTVALPLLPLPPSANRPAWSE